MQCREFREVSESYISDELLVETNHQINNHLEHCRECRTDFFARRELRKRVNRAGRNAPGFQIDPEFSRTLERRLKQEAFRTGFWNGLFRRPLFLVPTMTVILIAVGFGSFYLTGRGTFRVIETSSFSAGLAKMAHAAAGTHKDCALENLGRWEAMSKTAYLEKADYEERVLAPLKAKYSDGFEMLSVHDCIFDGRQFKHVVIRNKENIISVLFDKSDVILVQDNNSSNAITSEVESGFQVATFANKTQPIFIVSDLPETENLSVARILSLSFGLS